MNTLLESAKVVLAEWDTYLNQYPHMDKGYMLDAREALRKAVADAEGMVLVRIDEKCHGMMGGQPYRDHNY